MSRKCKRSQKRIRSIQRKRSYRRRSNKKLSRKRSFKRSPIRTIKHMIKTSNYIQPENEKNELYTEITKRVSRKKNPWETIEDEKYFTIEYPLIRESLLSKDIGLLGEIIKRVKVIEGPVTVAGLVPTEKLKQIMSNAPQIMLLGDYHVGSLGCRYYTKIECDLSEGCYTLYKANKENSFVHMLNQLGEEKRIGLFLEDWQLEQTEKSIFSGYGLEDEDIEDFLRMYKLGLGPEGHTSALGDTILELVSCYSQRKNKRNEDCLVKNIEIHMADPRKVYDKEYEQDLKYQADMIIQMYRKSLESRNPLQFMKRIQQKYFPKISYKTMMKNIKTILVDEFGYDEVFWNSELFDEYSRTKRQIKKIPKDLQNILRRYKIMKFETIRNGGGFLYNDSLDFNKSMKQILDELIDEKTPDSLLLNEIFEDENSFDYLFSMIHGNVYLLDLYYMGRTLRSSYSFDLSVGYFGSKHTTRIIDFLIKEGLYEKLFYYGPNNKWWNDEELSKNNFKYNMIEGKSLTMGKLYEKCIPLT